MGVRGSAVAQYGVLWLTMIHAPVFAATDWAHARAVAKLSWRCCRQLAPLATTFPGSGDYEAVRTDAISFDVVPWALPYQCFQSIGTGGGCRALPMSALFTGVNAGAPLPRAVPR